MLQSVTKRIEPDSLEDVYHHILIYLRRYYGESKFEQIRVKKAIPGERCVQFPESEWKDVHFGPFSKNVLDSETTKVFIKLLALIADSKRSSDTRVNEEDNYSNTMEKIYNDKVTVVVLDCTEREPVTKTMVVKTSPTANNLKSLWRKM